MIRVGVVGATGWADGSHLPALAALEAFEVTAVATTSQASADRAASAHGVRLAFADAGELAAHPDVDLLSLKVDCAGVGVQQDIDRGVSLLEPLDAWQQPL